MSRVLRIVVADDEPEMRLYYHRVLARMGHEVVAEAGDGEDLLACCRDHQPDLVIADVRMPRLDGLTAAERLQVQRPVLVLLVTAHVDPALVQRAETAHLLGYLVKPVKQADLAAALERATAWLDGQ